MATTPPNTEKARLATQPKDSTTFYVKKGRLQMLLGGIQAMQKRDDLSGKFARKCTQIGRALREALEKVMEEEKALQDLHKDKFPEGHPLAGQIKPVYAMDDLGKPVYKTDNAGNTTEEREIIPGQFTFRDPVKYNQDRLEMLKEIIVIEAPCFRVTDPESKDDKFVPELDRFTKVNGSAWDACADFEEGSPLVTPPKDVEAEPVESDGSEHPVAIADAETDRTAP